MNSTTAGDTLKSASDVLQQTMTTLANLVEQSTNLSFDLLNSFTRNLPNFDFSSVKMPAMPNLDFSSVKMPAMPNLDFSSMKMPGMPSCGCKIPPPCWMPQNAGCVVSHVCPGSPAVLCIRITNCGPTDRTIHLDDAGKNAVKFEPGALALGPMETGVVTATLTATPASSSGACEEGEQAALVWIRGCKDHYVRWTVKTVKRGAACCHEISVEDCPDFIHHWYDHFYCARPCTSQKRNG
jgi:hypothetical protein